MLSSQRVHITHVKQTHMPYGQTEVTSTDMEEIAYSQFKVCQAVISNPDALVVKESLYENYTPDLMSINQNADYAKKLFPNGLPKNYEELDEAQKNYLARRGVVALFDLGILSHVYKSLNKDEAQKINALMSANCFEAIYEPRELLAIKYAKEAAKSSSKQDVHVLLIFGEVHDFNSRINSYHDNNVIYAGCIETSLTKPNKVMSSADAVTSLYELLHVDRSSPQAECLLSRLSIFKSMVMVDEIDISRIPCSEDELPSSPGMESMQKGIDALKDQLSVINLKHLNLP